MNTRITSLKRNSKIIIEDDEENNYKINNDDNENMSCSSSSFMDMNHEKFSGLDDEVGTIGENDDDSTGIVHTLGKKETRALFVFRFILGFVLFALALLVSSLVYQFSHQYEVSDFERQYTDHAMKVVDAFLHNAQRRLDAIESLSVAITSYAIATNASWPNVTLPDFERRAYYVLDLADLLSITFIPIVSKKHRVGWEHYSVQNQHWFEEALEYQKVIKNVDDTDESEVSSIQHLTDLGEGINEGNELNDNMQIPTKIFRLNGAVTAPENGDGPYAVWWQFAPVFPVANIINYNALSTPSRVKDIESIIQTQTSVISQSIDISDESNSETMARKPVLNLFLNRWHQGGKDYQDGPMSDLYTPVFDHFQEEKEKEEEEAETSSSQRRTMTGILTSYIYWQVYFEDILPENAHGVMAVLENTCNQTYSYLIYGKIAQYIGPGDLHDSCYSHLEVSTGFGAFLQNHHHRQYQHTLNENHQKCIYNVRVYPTAEMEAMYITNTPWIFTSVVALSFVFTSIIFIGYDYFVERRQRLVMKTAVQSTEVVQSLFPSQVRDRLYEENENKHNHNNNNNNHNNHNNTKPTWNINNNTIIQKSFLPKSYWTTANHNNNRNHDDDVNESNIDDVTVGNDNNNLMSSSSPVIADLYDNCTVLFADIVGFTKWSSKRDPIQVFQLLESIYGTFDKIAKRRRVFKIETIGDCYLAVTGLPQPQPNDHAIIMCKFAVECMIKMNQLCHSTQLINQLGGDIHHDTDTAQLSMRFGLHSGSVTAGVLRGDRARFQLFGDTVNTASRMESNGKPGLIHISESTAQLLINAGKQTWIRKREDLIDAKGKGTLQTYWLESTLFTNRTSSSLGTHSVRSSSMSSSSQATPPPTLPTPPYYNLPITGTKSTLTEI